MRLQDRYIVPSLQPVKPYLDLGINPKDFEQVCYKMLHWSHKHSLAQETQLGSPDKHSLAQETQLGSPDLVIIVYNSD